MKAVICLFVVFVMLIMALVPTLAQADSVPSPTEGWPVSNPEEQGMDSERLSAAISFLQAQDGFNIHSLMIIRNGIIVADATFYPFEQGALHDLASVTKSFTSTLVGIAIDKDYIESIEQPILEFFPDHDIANIDADKQAITIGDLLTMSAGFDCIYQPIEITLNEMMGTPDWVQFVLDLPMAEAPNSRWVYCSPGVHLLSAIIERSTGMSTVAFAQEHLFGPLGISDVIWLPDPQGTNRGWGDLIMKPGDMAKLGYLYLQGGVWDGEQLLPADWVMSATTPSALADYGYLWWLNSDANFYFADGRGGQRIFVFPDLDMLVVTTGGGGEDQYGTLATLLDDYIIPAVGPNQPLPANPDGVALFDATVQQVAQAQDVTQPEPVPSLPEIAKVISGKTFMLDPNPLGLQAVALTFEAEAEATVAVTFYDGSQVEWVVGLDNVLRFGPGQFGLTAAAKGGWQSENTFSIFIDEIGRINQLQINTTFEDNQVIVELLGATLVGHLQE